MRRLICAATIVVATACLYTASAVSVRSWSASSAEAFAAGTLDGTAIDQEGRVRLAPSIETVWGPDEGIVWDVAAGPDSDAFVALSGPGRVLRVAPGREPEIWYEAEDETLVTAIASDGRGGVYIGLSPLGRVLHARSAGESEVAVETGSAFVWALAAVPDGTLWVGTGVPGKLLRRDADGAVRTAFDSGDDPVRSIVPAPEGGAVLGTGGKGRVVRVDRTDSAFVLFDADESEIVALSWLGGDLFALAAASAKQPSSRNGAAAAAAAAANAHVRVVATPPPDEKKEENRDRPAPRDQPRPPAQTFRSPAGGVLYRIAADGAVRAVWKTSKEMPFDLAVGDEEGLLVSTGDSGKIFLLDREGRSSQLLRIGSNHVSAMARATDGRTILGGTTDARVAYLGPGPRLEGSYVSPAIDAGTVAEWGRLRWEGESPRGAKLLVQVRAGNTEEPDDTWTPWKSVSGQPGPGGVESGLPPSRWMQIRVDLSSQRVQKPGLNRLEVFYRPQNRAPEITELKVEPSGLVLVPGPTQSSNRLGPLVADDPVARRAARQGRAGIAAQAPVRRGYEAGARTFSWRVADPDGDRLTYEIDLRMESGVHWFPLATDLRRRYHSWDARSLPDGFYRARLRVTDAADNPEGGGLVVERISDAFLVDNSRPVVGELEISAASGGHEVVFVASDPGGSVAAVEVAMDGGQWLPVDPLDGVADSEEERYELLVEPPAESTTEPRALRVRVTDAAGNLGGDLWVIEER